MRSDGQRKKEMKMFFKGKNIINISFIVLSIFISGAWWIVYTISSIDYSETTARAERDAKNLTRIIVEQVEKTIESIDFLLLHMLDDINEYSGSEDSLFSLYKTATARDKTLIQLSYADELGNIVASSVSRGSKGFNISDREHFIVHKNQSISGLFISRPVLGRVSGKWSIQLSRRISKTNGDFGGVVVASIDPFYFGNIFTDIDVGYNGLISIFKPDGYLLARKDMTDAILSTNVSGSPLFKSVSNRKSGFGRFASVIDGAIRLVAFQRLRHNDIVVASGFDESIFMEGHKSRNFYLLFSGSLVTIFACLTLTGIIFYTKSLHRINEELKTSEQRADSANRSKTMFLANMSHEIRTPMNAIIGLCDLIAKTMLSDKQKDYFQKVSTSARSLLAIINDILDISKIESGELKLDDSQFSLSVVLENVSNVTAYAATKKGVNLVYDVAADVPILFSGDPVRLGQIIINLVNNALKFTEAGDVVLSIRIDPGVTHACRLIFTVRDSGIGMTEEQQNAIFKPFVQADNTTTRRFGGTGLGLVICKRLCNAMGGDIRVESQIGSGSTFIFDVILKRSAQSQTLVDLIDDRIRSSTVLVIDDIAPERNALADFFRRISVNVVSIQSTFDAIEELTTSVARHTPYDCVIVNAFMPEIDGLDLVRIVKSDESLQPAPKFIIMHPYGYDDGHKVPEELHGCEFISKPISNIRLLASLAECRGTKLDLSNFIRTFTGGDEAYKFTDVTALLVDDNEINRQIARELLECAGINVVVATNGKDAVDMVLQNIGHYDLVLMDVQMPEMDGITATTLIRETIPASELPIIAMTAHAMEQERLRCLAAGMNDHISKPISANALYRILAGWLRGKSYSDGGEPLSASESANIMVEQKNPLAGDDELPAELPPFYLSEAIDNVNGNRSLIRTMLIKFSEIYATSPQDIAQFHEKGERDELRRLAHTLKGVTGSLQAKAASGAAAALERALLNDPTRDVKGLVQTLVATLQEALAAARTVKPDRPAGATEISQEETARKP